MYFTRQRVTANLVVFGAEVRIDEVREFVCFALGFALSSLAFNLGFERIFRHFSFLFNFRGFGFSIVKFLVLIRAQ